MHAREAERSEARPTAGGGDATFYRYRDASGRIVIVDSQERVPSSARRSAEAVVLAPAAEVSASDTARSLARELHVPSFIAGASLAALGALLLVVAQRKLGRVVRGALLLGVLGLGVVAYFGWVRRTTGQGSDLLASPEALIDDARAVVEKMNQRSAEQQRTLKELESAR
jgi:hypothetical protein